MSRKCAKYPKKSKKKYGNDLPSQNVSVPLLSALQGLTSVFGMGTGGAPAIWSPWIRVYKKR